MTVEDRLAIEDLYARYCVALDGGDEEGWVDTFTEDGEFFGRRAARGRAELHEYHRSRMAARAGEPISNPQHWNANLLLRGEPPEVRGFAYVLRLGASRTDGTIQVVTAGAYRDVIVKEADGWRFKRREVSFDGVPHTSMWG